MRKWIKILIGIIFTLTILVAASLIIFYNVLKSTLPEYEGETASSFVSSEVQIYRDSMAVPYIFAESDEDAAFALGFVHAQERLFQMDLIRRAGEGRLSEVLGNSTVQFDKMFLTIGIKRISEKLLNHISPETIKILEAYSKGVNHFIKNYNNKLSVEFDILNYQPYEWKPIHSIYIVRLMAWELNFSWYSDIVLSDIITKLGEEKGKEFLPNFSENMPTIIPSHLIKNDKKLSSFLENDKEFRKFFGWRGTHIGSNNWVVNGNKSVSGKPLIANDPHLAYSLPGKWFAAVIKSKNWNAAGVTLPGVPGIVIGKNENISWVLTNVMADESDFYIEKIDSSGNNYLLEGKWHKLSKYEEKIKVKGSDEIKFEIVSTHRGPIISEIHLFNIIYGSEIQKGLSMRWTGSEMTDELSAMLKVNKAKNWNEFLDGVKDFKLPGQNFVYGDKEGNIGYVCAAMLPIRESNNPTLVFDGTNKKNDWKGFVPFAEMPKLFNPAQNFIASANNKTVKDFKYYITNLWEPSSRIERINELLLNKEKHTAEDFMDYQNDFISLYAKKIVPFIIDAFSQVKVTDKNLNESLILFSNWDFSFDSKLQTPAIYSFFFKYLIRNIFEDELGEKLFNEYIYLSNITYRKVLELMGNKNSILFNNINTEKRETRDEIIRKSLADALEDLEKNYGKELKNWQWGKFHQVTFKHPFNGVSSLIDNYVNIGPHTIGGDGTTIFNTEYKFSKPSEIQQSHNWKPFENILGPSMRFIYDFANKSEFYIILTGGQSGNFMSKNYSDMFPLWSKKGYMKISTDENEIKSEPNKLFLIRRN